MAEESNAKHYVVVYNDDTHTFPYVIKLALKEITSDPRIASRVARQIDRRGKAAIEMTSSVEAEELQKRILSYGRDRLIPRSMGPLHVTVETTPLEEQFVFGRITDQRFYAAPACSIDLYPGEVREHFLRRFFMACILVFVVIALLFYGATNIF